MWGEEGFNIQALHETKDAVTMEPLTVSFMAALGHEYGDRVAVMTLPGVHKTIEEFTRAYEERKHMQIERGCSFLVLPLHEAYAYVEALTGFLHGVPGGKGAVKVTNCRICGRRLSDPESVRRGVGPVCHRKTQSSMGAAPEVSV